MHGKAARNQSPETQDASVIHQSQLTGVLARSHSVYKLTSHARKQSLGRVHPMALKMGMYSVSGGETPSRRAAVDRQSPPARPKARRIRLKLSSILARYIRSVVPPPTQVIHECTVAETGPPQLTRAVAAHSALLAVKAQLAELARHGQNQPADGISPLQEATMSRELESIMQSASYQTTHLAENSMAYLTARGYGLQDLAAWHWILSTKTAEDAALRLGTLLERSGPHRNDFGPVPMFVFLRLLLRTDIDLRALNLLIKHARQILGSLDQHKLRSDHDTALQSPPAKKYLEPIGLDAFVLFIVRLLRQARRVWPASYVAIAQLWTLHARPGRIIRQEMTDQDTARLSFCYNRILALLSLPPNESPYQSLPHRQRAQFVVIRQIKAFSPPLTISREGYRAVVRVQLAHRKTDRERKWARLKARSWPPWKEDKLGVDAFVGVEHGLSRASESLRQMAEAGYGPLDWEKTAGILAGWDTDRSPTIQTRSALIPSSRTDRTTDTAQPRTSAVHMEVQKLDGDAIWVARIRATRTLQEAWVCFLACKDQKKALTDEIYYAMLEKAILDEERKRRRVATNVHMEKKVEGEGPISGDGKEVEETSSSHNQAISTREPIPTSGELLTKMTTNGLRPSGRFLGFLLKHARTYKQGVQFLKVSALNDSVQRSLLRPTKEPIDDALSSLQTLPDWLFAAHVAFLCKVARVDRRISREKALRSMDALELVAIRKPFYRPPWNSVLTLLAWPRTVVTVGKGALDRHAQNLVKFREACQMLGRMDSIGLDLDFTGFRDVCDIVKNTLASARHILATTDDEEEERSAVQGLLDVGLSLVKARFSQLARPVDSSLEDGVFSNDSSRLSSDRPPRPRLARVPRPAHLHAYIRVLGQQPDYDGVAELVGWMSSFSEQIMREARESHNGLVAMRTCLIAVRVFVEQPLAESEEDEAAAAQDADVYEKRCQQVEKIRGIIVSNEDWDGWPTDEEVEQYIRSGEQGKVGDQEA